MFMVMVVIVMTTTLIVVMVMMVMLMVIMTATLVIVVMMVMVMLVLLMLFNHFIQQFLPKLNAILYSLKDCFSLQLIPGSGNYCSLGIMLPDKSNCGI